MRNKLKITKVLANNLKRLRTEQGQTLESLGDAVGISKQAVWKIENEESWVTLDTISKIATALNIEEHLLFQVDTSKIK